MGEPSNTNSISSAFYDPIEVKNAKKTTVNDEENLIKEEPPAPNATNASCFTLE